jgi:3D (Asp-Asp-Asp) domain-containing protein
MQYLYTTALIISTSIFNPLAAPETKIESGYSAPIKIMYDVKQIESPVTTPVVQPVVEEPKGKWVTAIVTAYSPHARSCGKWSHLGKTSTGVKVRTPNPDDAYGIAADPKVIPYGTKVYVPGYYEMLQNNKTCIPTEMTEVDDTGGGMRQSARRGIIHIDVRFRTEKAAKEWGKKKMDIFIYDE